MATTYTRKYKALRHKASWLGWKKLYREEGQDFLANSLQPILRDESETLEDLASFYPQIEAKVIEECVLVTVTVEFPA